MVEDVDMIKKAEELLEKAAENNDISLLTESQGYHLMATGSLCTTSKKTLRLVEHLAGKKKCKIFWFEFEGYSWQDIGRVIGVVAIIGVFVLIFLQHLGINIKDYIPARQDIPAAVATTSP